MARDAPGDLRQTGAGATGHAGRVGHPPAAGTDDPRAALRLHLADFARFVVAAHLLARRRLRLPTPYRARLPLAFSGTRLMLVGASTDDSRTVLVHGVARGRLQVAVDGVDAEIAATARDVSHDRSPFRLVRAPVVRIGR